MITGCTEKNSQHTKESGRKPSPSDTLYTQQRAMAVYGYQPVRALQIIDSAVIVGNLSEVWADVNRVRIYSQSLMAEQLDSLIGGPQGVRFDTARAIAGRLLQHDSLKANHKLRQDVLEMLIYTVSKQQDSLSWLHYSRELIDECRHHGAETKALRTEAELGAALCYSGQQEQGMAMLDSVIRSLSPDPSTGRGGGAEAFGFNELDALIIASKRKINVLASLDREEEALPLARRLIELLDDYEQHPDQYHDGSYREPQNDTKRTDYIRFYRSQAQSFITAAYTALGDKSNMTESYEKIERTVRDATAREHIARYNALQQQMETERQRALAERSQLTTIIFAILLTAALAALVWYWHQKRVINWKNRALVRYIEKSLNSPTPDPDYGGEGNIYISRGSATDKPATLPSAGGEGDEALFAQIHDTIVREQLYLDPACDRQMLTDRFHLSKERLGALFAQHCKTSRPAEGHLQGKNISAYINGLRLDHASRLLTTQPDIDIRQVATQSGFNSHQYFSNCFKQRFGLSPTDYRRAKNADDFAK